MNKKPIPFFVALLLLLLATASITGCTNGAALVTFDQLYTNPSKYNNQKITLEGFYFHGLESIVLSERLELSGFAPGHLVPKGRMIWIEGGVPKEIEDGLNREQQMGPVELYGKVSMTGTFEYGGKYGHLGGFDHQITPTETELLPWSPPASQELEEGFAIYLTKEDILPAQMPALNHVELVDQPVIGMDDIITYNAQTHELKLIAEAFERVSQLDVPVRGRSFMVCVDRQPVYFGAFWMPVSSISFEGVTIWQPLGPQENNIITFELGYTSSSFYSGNDPRNSPEILAALEKGGKLIDKLTLMDVDSLPHSMKGYELYSWQVDNQWHFTLITGTNRNKTLEEIISEDDFISETGCVNTRVAGIEDVKPALGKLPKNESVYWLAGMREAGVQSAVNICLPSEQVIQNLKNTPLNVVLILLYKRLE